MKTILSAIVGLIPLAVVYFIPLMAQELPEVAMADEGWSMDGGPMGHGVGYGSWDGRLPWTARCEGDAEKCRAEMQTRMQEYFKEQFKQADSDGTGTLSRAEIEQAMPMLAHNFDEIDTNKDGQISLEEFEVYGKKKMEAIAMRRDACKADPDKCHAELLDHMKELFKKADVNGDGVLTMAEAEQGSPMIARQFYELDINKDGQVSLKEFEDFHKRQYENFKKKRAQTLDRLEKQFKKADANHDGMLSVAEAEKGMPDLAKCFAEVDTNHDGMISLDEAKATVPTHPGRGYGPGGGMMMEGWHKHGMPPPGPSEDDEQHSNAPPLAPAAM